MIQQKKSEQNGFIIKMKNPSSTKNLIPNNMIALKKIQNYSYALNDQIGLGFTSHVYRGKDQVTNKQVAVKVVQLKKNKDELQTHFLQDEITVLQIIKNADSTNLLKLQKVIKSKNNLYIITQYCQGSDLAKILRKKKLFSQIQAQTIMKQLIYGYKELYRLKLIHRDLKLANLFITKGKIKIADFGFTVNQNVCNLQFQYNVGSPYYMAPQSLKQNIYSFQSDVWAIGVICYQLVYGKVPWKDRDDIVLYEMLMNSPVQKLFDGDKQVSEHYKKFIKSCLVTDRRYRASPQFMINYQWPLAREYFDGLDDGNQFRNSTGGKGSILRLSLDRPTIKKLKNITIQQPQKGLRRRTPSMDNLQTLTKLQQKPPSYLPQNNDTIHKNPVQKLLDMNKDKKIIHRKQRSRSSSRQQQNKKLFFIQSFQLFSFQTQVAILGQIHYCRFMFELIKIIKNFQVIYQHTNIVQELSNQIYNHMQTLVATAKNQQNTFHSPGFQNYIKTARWQNLRQIIYQYDMKYRQELAINRNCQNKSMENASQLIQIIRDLCLNLPKNIKIVELLTYYYQIKQQENKIPSHELNNKIKFQYLIDECRNFYQLNKYYDTNLSQQLENKERLIKKLGILEI